MGGHAGRTLFTVRTFAVWFMKAQFKLVKLGCLMHFEMYHGGSGVAANQIDIWLGDFQGISAKQWSV